MTPDLIEFVQSALAARADPEKAGYMQAYMKTDISSFNLYIRRHLAP